MTAEAHEKHDNLRETSREQHGKPREQCEMNESKDESVVKLGARKCERDERETRKNKEDRNWRNMRAAANVCERQILATTNKKPREPREIEPREPTSQPDTEQYG
eukprot:4430300-Ditylum_brightwellii.AAC.1